MAAGDATAADVPGLYDCVINGKGYVFLDSVEESIPFRTHRADYSFTQPFVERQNVSNQYGDNAQDFFLTVRQRDWSLGEQQKYYRAGQDGRYWMGSNVDVTIPGQVSLSPSVSTLSFAGAVRAGARQPNNGAHDIVVVSATNAYNVDGTDGTITDLGAHGLGATPSKFGIATDAVSNYISTTTAGTVGVRKLTGGVYSTFSATGSDSLAFLNNTLYGFRLSGSGGDLIRYDTAGVATSLFAWKDAAGGQAPNVIPRLAPYGGKLLLLFPYAQEAAELWIYDGAGVARLDVFPENFYANDMEILYGVAYIAGSFIKSAGTGLVNVKPAVLWFDGSQVGLLWQANSFSSFTISFPSNEQPGPHAALGVSSGRLIFTDDTTGNIMAYNPSLGGVSTIGSYTVTGTYPQIISTGLAQVHTRNQTTGYLFPSSTFPTSGYVISSLVDFDSSLTKVFRGVSVEFDSATDGNGGSVDIAYQTDVLTGSWTTLQTGATSGTEYTLSNVSGKRIAIKVTLNKGTSTAGPTLKSVNVRAAPRMPQYPRCTYVIDCTNTEGDPRELRDGTYHPLTGYDQMQNLVSAAKSSTPITVIDKANGSYTAFVDLNDPDGFDVYEIHPAPENKEKAGSYVVRLTTRGV